MTLLDLLKNRLKVAEKFTQVQIDDVKRSISDYNAKSADLISSGDNAVNKRYEFVVPLIFTNVEGMKASMFDRDPELIFNGRGNLDDNKKRKVIAAYEYLKDKLNLGEFAWNAAHWFILNGFVSAHTSFKSETYEAPVFDENGVPQADEMGQPITQALYSYNDPVVELGDPLKESYSPESEFSVDGDKIPYYFRWKMMEIDEVKATYGVDVKPDSDVGGKDEEYGKSSDDTKRAKVYFYCGRLPSDVKTEVEDWTYDSNYYVIFTTEKTLYIEPRKDHQTKLGRWYAQPNAFFGFGMGRVGREFQVEKSIRRGQEIRLADVAAFPKYGLQNDGVNKTAPKDILDPRANTIFFYETLPPIILQPGNLAPIVSANIAEVDKDAQQAFGMMDISQGGQQGTVDTATGQTIFADASEKRVRLAKKYFMKFYQAIMIQCLKLAQENWDEEKLVKITDDITGEETTETVSADDLKDVDFDNDIEVDSETASVNKDVLREQYIALYDKVKDDPLIDRRPLFKDLIKMGFNGINPERYMKKSTIPAGTIMTDQNGIQYQTQDDGTVITQEEAMQLGTSGGERTAQSEGAVLG